jgi:hypothetical protein
MCRFEAKKHWDRHADYEAAGATRIVALVKEDLDTEVQDFRPFWGGDVLLDSEKAFFKAIGGGAVHQPYSLASFLAAAFNPFCKARVKGHMDVAKKAGITQNLKGEGFVAGGSYVLDKSGAVQFSFVEDDLGDHAQPEAIVDALKVACGT